MSELVQLNLSVDRDLSDLVEELARHHGWTKRQAVTAAVEALKVLMKRHETTAAKASEEDVGELFLRVARLMPAGLTDAKVEWGRLSDGRPALIVRDWVIADDGSGDLMAVRRDGSQVAYLAHGDIEVLAERAFRGPTTPLKAPDQVALN